MVKFKNKIWFLFVILSSLVLLSLLFGCGGGGSQVGGEKDTPIIPQTTKVLDQNTLQNISFSPDGTALTITGQSPAVQSLSTGDILIGGVTTATPNGLIRRVTAINVTSSQTVVQTTAATLEDAIQHGTIDVQSTLTPDNVRLSSALRKGVSLMPKNTLSLSNKFALALDNVVLYDADGDNHTTNDQITANGSIELEPSFSFKASIDNFQLKTLNFTNTTKETAQIQLSTKASIASINKEVSIYSVTLSPITIMVGYVPVVITPVLTVNVGINGEVSVGITAGVTQKATMTAGLNYDDKGWSPIHDFSTDFQFNAPTLSAGASVKAYAGPQLNLMIYGVVGPYANINGYLELDADLLSNPWWQLYGGLNANVGLKIEVLSHVIAAYNATVVDYRILIAKADNVNPGNSPNTYKLYAVSKFCQVPSTCGTQDYVYIGTFRGTQTITLPENTLTIRIENPAGSETKLDAVEFQNKQGVKLGYIGYDAKDNAVGTWLMSGPWLPPAGCDGNSVTDSTNAILGSPDNVYTVLGATCGTEKGDKNKTFIDHNLASFLETTFDGTKTFQRIVVYTGN